MKIWENKREREIVFCGKWKIGGAILEVRCDICDSNLIRFDKYDANFCPICNEWLDPNCSYCNNRPDTPFHEFYR